MDLKEDYSKLPQISQELNTLEDEADSVVHQIVQELIYDHSREGEEKADKINRKWLRILMTTPLKEPDEFLGRVVLKEVVDILEDTMDQCEDVANILDTFRVKKLFFYYESGF